MSTVSTSPVLSPGASARLEQELAALVEERMLRATEPIGSSGDAADLAEFAARDMLLERLDERIAGIRGLLAEASFSRPQAAAPAGVASPGTLLDLRFGKSRGTETFLLGHLAEADGSVEVITLQSPLGRAVLGATAGTKVSYGAPAGSVDVTVVGVRPA